MNNDSAPKDSQTDWDALDALADDEIDLSEIPEVTTEQMVRAKLRVGGKLIAIDASMVFQYDPDHDMLYIKLVDRASAESEEVAPGIVLDFDEQNQVVGIEIEDASKFIDLSRLEVLALPIANLILSERGPAST